MIDQPSKNPYLGKTSFVPRPNQPAAEHLKRDPAFIAEHQRLWDEAKQLEQEHRSTSGNPLELMP